LPGCWRYTIGRCLSLFTQLLPTFCFPTRHLMCRPFCPASGRWVSTTSFLI
jgi:hypothetical protein